MRNLLLIVLSLASGSIRADVALAHSPPNIVILLSDDQAWTDYGFMEHPAIDTPHIDRLAASGTVFTRGYVPTALCRPSLTTIVSGLYASQHGIAGNDPAPTEAAPEGSPANDDLRSNLISRIDEVATLPRLLAEAGYLSFQSGKWWEGHFTRGGFTDGMTQGFQNTGKGRHGDHGLSIGREGLAPVFNFIDHAQAEKKPFFLWYAPFMPHKPHNPPERLLTKYESRTTSMRLARYYAMCEWFDETCGAVIDHVKAAGLSQNTLFVYLSDNGWLQDPEKNDFAPRSKLTPYDAGVRQPIIFAMPGRIPKGVREDLASSLDVFPTILSLAGIEMPELTPGIDLLPFLESGNAIPRDALFGQSFAHDIADLSDPTESLIYEWIIEGRWKLIVERGGKADARIRMADPRIGKGPQLYHLGLDPFERRNLVESPTYAEIRKRLETRLNNWVTNGRRN